MAKEKDIKQYPYLDDQGYTILDPNPIAVPLTAKLPETLETKMRRFERAKELMRQWELNQAETKLEDEMKSVLAEKAGDFFYDDDDFDEPTLFNPDELNISPDKSPEPVSQPTADEGIDANASVNEPQNEVKE